MKFEDFTENENSKGRRISDMICTDDTKIIEAELLLTTGDKIKLIDRMSIDFYDDCIRKKYKQNGKKKEVIENDKQIIRNTVY